MERRETENNDEKIGMSIGEILSAANARVKRGILLTEPQPYPNHNGGWIGFDADGMLLIALGDGGSGGDPENRASNLQNRLGKMLRVDVLGAGAGQPYAIPADNPYAGRTDALPEILHSGLRNPFRDSIDPLTGDLWIGDVGQGDWEEVDAIPYGTGGVNLGWNVMEGERCYGASTCDKTDLRLPVVTIGHGQGACSVIGGYVYRGSAIPALVGGYLYTDLCMRTLWALDAAQGVTSGVALPVEVGKGTGTMVSFGEGDDGELYVVDQGGFVLKVTAGG